MIVKVGFCVAYDWQFLMYSLPSIYKYVDAICLSVDSERKSWNGNAFEIDWEGFTGLIQKIDTDGKIQILQESFFSKDRTPIANECFQRKRMADTLGKADWIVQLDTDEILVDPAGFIKELDRYKSLRRPVNIHGVWINLIKQTESGFIYSIVKTPPLATNHPAYEYGRTNGHFNVYTNTFLAHITWARPEEEVYYKLKNWGHSHEFNGMSFFKIWQALDGHNWKYIKDFHPMNKGNIPQLYFIEAKNIEELLAVVDCKKHSLSLKELLSNNIWLSRIKKVLKSVKQ